MYCTKFIVAFFCLVGLAIAQATSLPGGTVTNVANDTNVTNVTDVCGEVSQAGQVRRAISAIIAFADHVYRDDSLHKVDTDDALEARRLKGPGFRNPCEENQSQASLSPAAIVGIVIAVVAGVGVAIIILWCLYSICCRPRTPKHAAQSSTKQPEPDIELGCGTSTPAPLEPTIPQAAYPYMVRGYQIA